MFFLDKMVLRFSQLEQLLLPSVTQDEIYCDIIFIIWMQFRMSLYLCEADGINVLDVGMWIMDHVEYWNVYHVYIYLYKKQ